MMYEYEYIINNAASSLEAELLALQVFWRLSTTQRRRCLVDSDSKCCCFNWFHSRLCRAIIWYCGGVWPMTFLMDTLCC